MSEKDAELPIFQRCLREMQSCLHFSVLVVWMVAATEPLQEDSFVYGSLECATKFCCWAFLQDYITENGRDDDERLTFNLAARVLRDNDIGGQLQS